MRDTQPQNSSADSHYVYPKRHENRGVDPSGYAQDFDSCTAVDVLRMAFYGALCPGSDSFLTCATQTNRGWGRRACDDPCLSNLVRGCHPSVVRHAVFLSEFAENRWSSVGPKLVFFQLVQFQKLNWIHFFFIHTGPNTPLYVNSSFGFSPLRRTPREARKV